MNIIRRYLPEGQFVRETTPKNQIVLHHTASGPGVDGDIAWWEGTPERVATHFIIDRQGQVWQLIAEEHWAHHLGVSAETFRRLGLPYLNLDRQSIGIELDSWGQVERGTDGKFHPVGAKFRNRTVENVHEYCRSNPFKGHAYYERYTTPQLDSLRCLLRELCQRHGIRKGYNTSMWAVLPAALKGENGIFTHCSYRADKSDCHPQPELINILKTL